MLLSFCFLVWFSKPSMDLHLVPIVSFLSLALVVTSATLPSEDYWQSMLPNTRMPKAIRDLLPSGSVNVGKGGVDVNTGKAMSGKGTSKADSGTSVDVGKGRVSMNIGPNMLVNVNPSKNSLVWYTKYAASEDQLRDDPNVALFFQEKDLRPGTTMNLHFTKTTTGATFLPRQEAETIPFSTKKFSTILQRFSVTPRSKEAQVMKKTIQGCEEPAVLGEDKYCATSLESMVDFTTSKLGTNVQALLTEVEKEETQKQKYTITSGVKKIASNKAVVCHSQPYVYPVFYCHATSSTRAYKVALVGADGTKANAVAVCHIDTAKWNPKHLAFQVLKVKPGTTPVCHFLPEDHVVWVQN